MKSILNNSRILILCVINIAVIFWIVWYHGQIQYEPLLDYANLEEKIFPLHKKVYNAIIVTIIVNILVMVLELRKLRNRKIIKSDLIIGFTYFFQIMLCMMWGYLYISSRSHNGIIDEYNTLFRFPIWIFGEESFTSVFSVTNIYLSLCFIHICICLSYAYWGIDGNRGGQGICDHFLS